MQPQPLSRPLWSLLARKTAPMTVRDLAQATSGRRNAVVRILARWERAGFVRRLPDQKPIRIIMAPDIRKYESPPRADSVAPPRTTARQRIWASIRILKRFDVPTLQITAEASRRAVETYINALMRAGYVRRVTRGHHKAGSWSVYQLALNTGRRAPAVTQRDGATIILDRNNGTRREIRSERDAPDGGEVNHVC